MSSKMDLRFVYHQLRVHVEGIPKVHFELVLGT